MKITRFFAAAVLVTMAFLPSTYIHAVSNKTLKPPIIDRVITNDKVIALTFDADMTYGMLAELQQKKVPNWYNAGVIDILKHEQTPATFFLTGLWAKTYPEVVQSLAQDKQFELANHTFSHPGFTQPCYRLPQVAEKNKPQQVTATESLLQKFPNYQHFFRFPGFCHNQTDIELVQKLGYTVIGGTVISPDAFNVNAASITRFITKRATSGGIIVLHLNGGPNAPATAAALAKVIPELKKSGYTFVTVSQLLTHGQPSE